MSRLNLLVVVVVLLVASPLTRLTPGFAAGLTLSSSTLTVYHTTYSSPSTCIASADGDGHVRSDLSGSNFGATVTLDVSSATAGTIRTYIRFDLASCAIPTGAIVTSASVKLTIAAIAVGTRTYDMHLVTANWTETGITWASQPGVAGQASSSVSVATGAATGTVYEWSVVGDVQGFITGATTNLGWRIADSAEGTAVSNLVSFDSREAAASPPQLVVTYVI